MTQRSNEVKPMGQADMTICANVRNAWVSFCSARSNRIVGVHILTPPATEPLEAGRREATVISRLLACAFLLTALMSGPWCYSADLVLIRSAIAPAPEQDQLEVATQFYGLDLRVVTVGTANTAKAFDLVRSRETLAVAIEANALSAVDQSALLRALHRAPGANVPLLILGVTQEINPALLGAWSGGTVIGVNRINESKTSHYVVGRVSGITQQLSGMDLPLPSGSTGAYFKLSGQSPLQEIFAVQSQTVKAPVFTLFTLNQQQVFLLCRAETQVNRESAVRRAPDTVGAFTAIAPVMMFVRYSAGERGWHSPHHYANLTIDDPWLREPYGHLEYKNLLAEMDKHNFHTTIAFIPWNYDRSDAEVASLFRGHPDRFSICIHGDNHDHKEFDDFQSKSQSLQVADLKQALARMEKFRSLTGIPYDRVFVFPHSIGSGRILQELKTYNYLATVNSTNVPMDGAPPAASSFDLRPVTTSFGDFPSIVRHPTVVQWPEQLIAVNEFLDNPLFFYTHQDFFAGGIGAFDRVADQVNRLEPTTQWKSLGDIVTHLYLLRRRIDSDYDLFTFSSSVRLENTSGDVRVYHITKREPAPSMIKAITVDARPVPLRIQGELLSCDIAVPAGQARSMLIIYKNDLDLASIDTSKKSLRVLFLREASDLRDIWLSKFGFGEAATALYYQNGGSPTRVLTLAFLVLLLAAATIWGLQKKRSKSAASAILAPNKTTNRRNTDSIGR
jgi:hypothetical protein